MPAVDIKEEDQQFVMTADLPGVDLKDIEVTDSQAIKARHVNGVLEIVIPKQPNVLPRKISVDTH